MSTLEIDIGDLRAARGRFYRERIRCDIPATAAGSRPRSIGIHAYKAVSAAERANYEDHADGHSLA